MKKLSKISTVKRVVSSRFHVVDDKEYVRSNHNLGVAVKKLFKISAINSSRVQVVNDKEYIEVTIILVLSLRNFSKSVLSKMFSAEIFE